MDDSNRKRAELETFERELREILRLHERWKNDLVQLLMVGVAAASFALLLALLAAPSRGWEVKVAATAASFGVTLGVGLRVGDGLNAASWRRWRSERIRAHLRLHEHPGFGSEELSNEFKSDRVGDVAVGVLFLSPMVGSLFAALSIAPVTAYGWFAGGLVALVVFGRWSDQDSKERGAIERVEDADGWNRRPAK